MHFQNLGNKMLEFSAPPPQKKNLFPTTQTIFLRTPLWPVTALRKLNISYQNYLLGAQELGRMRDLQ